ncbi:hypothetical protein OF83DRAFT_1175267 [Amylostereum chailletii]|nr:hypothetical protein OF83DRAFT_1175267 [Amylostereum chailletii]
MAKKKSPPEGEPTPLPSRPSRNGACLHPGEVINEAYPQRRTSAQKKADDEKAARLKESIAQATAEEYNQKVQHLAEMWDHVRQEEALYGHADAISQPTTQRRARKRPVEKLPAPDLAQDLEHPPIDTPPKQKRKPAVPKPRKVAPRTAATSKTAAAKATHSVEPHQEDHPPNTSGHIDVAGPDDDGRTTSSETLDPTFAPDIDELGQGTLPMDGDDADDDQDLGVAHGKPKKTRNTKPGKRGKHALRATVTDLQDEPARMNTPLNDKKRKAIERADVAPDPSRTTTPGNDQAKNLLVQNVGTQHAKAGSGRRTSEMGLKVVPKNGDDAVQEVKKEAEIEVAKFKYKDLKISDVPLRMVEDRVMWNETFVPASIAWAACQHDPFGTNELPSHEQFLRSQWIKNFPHIKLDDAKAFAAVKKMSGDRQNDMRSSIVLRALAVIEDLFKKPKFVHNNQARVDFVVSMLPKDEYSTPPLIYADPVLSSGAFKNPLFLTIFASFVKRSKPDAKARPIGAAGLCAAGLERALRLHETGTNQKTAALEEAKMKRANGSKATISKGVNFDNTWSATARSYTISASKLTDKKWDAIYRALQPYLGMDDSGDSSTAAGPADIDDVTTDPRANLVLSDDDSDDDNDNVGLKDFDAPPHNSASEQSDSDGGSERSHSGGSDRDNDDCSSDVLFGDYIPGQADAEGGEEAEGDEDEGDEDGDEGITTSQ